uniref:Uncharacterized protein n=1 Tax=viral metagenome TaxID=1070528 RepID=A0A6C0KWD3_9ZZZZ
MSKKRSRTSGVEEMDIQGSEEHVDPIFIDTKEKLKQILVRVFKVHYSDSRLDDREREYVIDDERLDKITNLYIDIAGANIDDPAFMLAFLLNHYAMTSSGEITSGTVVRRYLIYIEGYPKEIGKYSSIKIDNFTGYREGVQRIEFDDKRLDFTYREFLERVDDYLIHNLSHIDPLHFAAAWGLKHKKSKKSKKSKKTKKSKKSNNKSKKSKKSNKRKTNKK